MITNFLQQFFNKGSQRSVKARKNIVLMFVIKGLSILINLAYIPLLIHTLNTEVYGIWLTITSIVAWLGFFDVGLGHGLRNKFAGAVAANNLQLAKSYVSTSYVIMGVIALSILIIQFIVFPLVNWSTVLNAPQSMNSELRILILFVSSLFCIQLILKLITSIMLALQMPAFSNITITSSQLISFTIIFLIVKLGIQTSLLKLGIIISLSPIIVLLGFTIFIFSGKYSVYKPTFSSFDKHLIKSVLSLGVNFFAIQLIALLLFQANNVIIAHVCGTTYVTEYYIAYSYIGIINMIFYILVTPYWSATTDAFALKDFHWIKASINLLNKSWFILMTLGIILIGISKYVYRIWIGNALHVHYSVLILTLVYFAVYMRWGLFGSFINGIGKIKLQLYITLVEALIHIPLALLLGSKFGIEGVLMSMIITNAFNVIWPSIQVRKIINGSAKGIWNK